MGKRSRQRAGEATESAKPKRTLRERADAASRVAEQQIKQRPAAPWDPFPLTELAVVFGLGLLIAGFLIGGQTGKGLIAAGVVLAALSGLETAIREHFGGYRPHAGLLAGIVSLISLILSTSLLTIGIPVRAAIAIGVFAIVFPALRRSFIRKSGGSGVL